MRFFARFAMRGPFHAALCAAAVILLSPAVAFLVIISGAVVTLVTLRHGSREGLKVMGLAAAAIAAVRLAGGVSPLPFVVLGLVVWLPGWVMALNLSRTRQQALPLLMVAVLVLAYAVAIRLSVDDIGSFWGARLAAMFDAVAAEGGPRLRPEQIAILARQVHAWTLVAMFGMLVAMVFLARWWQAALYNPGGFGEEFRALRLPRVLLPLAALSALGMVLHLGGVATLALVGDAFVIVVVLFAFQGLAVIHFRARAVALGRGWLTALYVLLVLMPQLVGPVLATVGVADGVGDFRRLAAPRQED